MDDQKLAEIVRAMQDLLRPHLAQSEPARRLGALVGEWLLDACREAEGLSESAVRAAEPEEAPVEPGREPALEPVGAATPPEPDDDQPGMDDREPVESPAAPSSDRGPSATRPSFWTLGDVAGARRATTPPPDRAAGEEQAPAPRSEPKLSLIEERCRLKARACRVFIDRRQAMGDRAREAPLVDQVDQMLGESKDLENCFLWMVYREREQPDDETLRLIAEGYDALAASAALMRRVDELEGAARLADTIQAMHLLAWADSALRQAISRSWLTMPDIDQEEAHWWLRQNTTRRNIFVSRHMRLTDPADPERSAELLGKIEQLRCEVEARAAAFERAHAAFKRMRYHARRAASDGDRPDPHDLQRICDAIGEVLELGVPDSDRRFTQAVPPEIATRLLSSGREDGHRELLERLARPPDEEQAGADPGDREWSERVHRVRQLLENRQVVIIGGQPRVEAAERLETAFGLSSVEWVRLTEHGSSEPMRAPIADPETALVLVLVKLAGHQQIEEANTFASRLGKPCVLVRAGYNPEAIANAVLQQASQQLLAARGAQGSALRHDPHAPHG